MIEFINRTYSELQSRYAAVLVEPSQYVRKTKRTFFDIAGFRHHETVITNFYAYYLDPSEDHGLGDAFLNAFIAVAEKNNTSPFKFSSSTDIEVWTNYHTDGKNFIDIVLTNKDGANKITDALIIENKIYHWLHNDLKDYYESVKADRKLAVLLTLHKNEANNAHHFINITHWEVIHEVVAANAVKLWEMSEGQTLILRDFFNNLKNLTNNYQDVMEDSIKFYYDNATKIEELDKIKVEVKSNLIQKVINSIKKFTVKIPLADNWGPFFVVSDRGYRLYFRTEELFTHKTFTIALYIVHTIVREWPEDTFGLSSKYPEITWINPAQESGWFKIAFKEYSNIQQDAILGFEEVLNKIYVRDWKQLIEELPGIVEKSTK